jgi:hypothetical protein
MDEEYKGYTITPNSRELPNGLWLPVAELEIHHQGQVTTKPPVVAPESAAQKNRREADDYAVKMGRKWINERG